MRLLAIDFGFKRIGIAIGNSEFAIATSKPTLKASGKLKTDAEAIYQIAKKEDAEAFVVGIPYFSDGSESKFTKICLKFTEELKKFNLPVHTIDEAISSIQADTQLKEMGYKGAARKKLKDSEAACEILYRYFKNKP